LTLLFTSRRLIIRVEVIKIFASVALFRQRLFSPKLWMCAPFSGRQSGALVAWFITEEQAPLLLEHPARSVREKGVYKEPLLL